MSYSYDGFYTMSFLGHYVLKQHILIFGGGVRGFGIISNDACNLLWALFSRVTPGNAIGNGVGLVLCEHVLTSVLSL